MDKKLQKDLQAAQETEAILTHLFTVILPQYKKLDSIDHGISHIIDVLSRITELAVEFNLDRVTCWVIAVYHDLGQMFGRDNHEINSAKLFMEDNYLKSIMSEKQRVIIKEAIEDHRSSKGKIKPRSIYGCAICEADKDLKLDCILPKYIKAARERYGFDDEKLVQWAYADLVDKYGNNGSVTFWLNTKRNRKDRERLRKTLTSYEAFEAASVTYLSKK